MLIAKAYLRHRPVGLVSYGLARPAGPPGPLRLPIARPSCKVVHDPRNERLKLLGANANQLVHFRNLLAESSQIGKVTAYAIKGQKTLWESLGFRREGTIQGYFRDGSDASIWASYPKKERAQEPDRHQHESSLKTAQAKELLSEVRLPPGYTTRVVTPDEADKVADLMRSIFPVYPTPLTTEAIRQQIFSGASHFRCVCDAEGECVAVASAEFDHARLNAEMTDCATRPDQRGRGLMAFLVHRLERDVFLRHNIEDFYSLARAQETAMNCVFKKLGYAYQGRLINNCRMPSGWESMHIWCKRYSGL